jgi:hypothetical protein
VDAESEGAYEKMPMKTSVRKHYEADYALGRWNHPHLTDLVNIQAECTVTEGTSITEAGEQLTWRPFCTGCCLGLGNGRRAVGLRQLREMWKPL